MTPDQLTALAQRLRDHAADYAAHPDDACKHSDLLAAAEYLRQCAQAKPVAWLHREPKSGDQWLADDEAEGRACPDCRPVYTHPQPPSAQADADWYCPTCKCSVPGAHVTFDETHYTRFGGCGSKVSAVDPQADAVEALKFAASALDDAAACIEDWSAYASDYFREKHDAEGDAKIARQAAVKIRAVLAAQGGNDE